MVKKTQNGFSLIELLVVLVIIAVIAALAVPALLRARQAAENGNAFSSLRTMVSTETSFYATNGRYARLDELNGGVNGGFGTISEDKLLRSGFVFVMNPAKPSDEQLREGFHITATRAVGGDLPYALDVDQSGRIIELYNNAPQ